METNSFNKRRVIRKRIKSIKIRKNEDVYDITTTKNHNFFANNILVHNCGEVPLGAYGVCCLGSIVLPNFIVNKNTNYKRMGEIIRLGVRFLDNVLDVNRYILDEYQQSAHNGRRIGLGVMGLGEYLFAKKIRYGSEKSILEIEKLMKFIRDTVYDESVQLSSEKGSFPKYSQIEYMKSHFIRSLPASLRMSIKKHEIRNVTSMAIAPTGTLSMIREVTPSIEPLILKGYEKKDCVSNRYYVHPLYEKILLEEGETPDWFVDTNDLNPSNHLDVQAAVQKYVDGAVSKTINMPKGTTPDQLSDLLLEHIHDLKGVTVYVDGSKGDQPFNSITEEQALEFIRNKNVTNNIDESLVQCANGKCDI